jgi:hypothetical protein
MKTIELAGGHIAKVDDEDYDRLSTYRWCRAQGYARTSIYLGGGRKNQKRRTLAMHRLAMNAQPGQMVDHIDGDFLNNQKSNLRFCTPSQNQANSRRRGRFSSRYKGVSKHGDGWVATLCGDHLVWTRSEEDAALVYALAARERFGDFAYSEVIETRLLEDGEDD